MKAWSMKVCRKCGGRRIEGPRYIKGEEVLRFRCPCGFVWDEKIHDGQN